MRIGLGALAVLALASGACSSVHTYSGTVVDGNDVPIELIRVEVIRQAPTPFASPKVLARTTADARGRFKVEAPRRSTYLLIGGWEVDAAAAVGAEYPRIPLPGDEGD